MAAHPHARARALALLCLGWCACGPGESAAGPGWTGGAWLTLVAGRESDQTLDPGPPVTTVPGGPFVGGVGGVRWRRGARRGTHLEAAAQGWYERFTEAHGRTVASGALVSDLQFGLGRSWAARVGAGGHLLDDSARAEARRGAGWGEGGLVWLPGAWRLELQAGLEGRRHPDLLAPDDEGRLGRYTELRTTAGAHAEVRPWRRLLLRAAWHDLRTDARDPAYDARGPTFEAAAEARFGDVGLLVDAFQQERTFTSRDDERDRYRQLGVGVHVGLGAGWRARATLALTRYHWPEGPCVDTERAQLALTRLFGAEVAPRLPDPGLLERDVVDDLPRAGRLLAFRVHAPRARQVALVGDFNDWDPATHPLRRTGGGWWRVACRLPAGTHAYAYVVDGVWLTPPEARATVDDGLGGRNGLLVVLP